MYSYALLTGGSGLLGTELQKISNDYNIDYVAPSSKELDISSPEKIDEFIDNHEYLLENITSIVHCAAWTDVPNAEKNKEKVMNINVLGTYYLYNKLCDRFNCRFVYISTDYVYPGSTGQYKETDRTGPINFYSFTKLAAESCIRDRGEFDDLIIRTSFKPSKWEYKKAFNDIYTSADYVDVIAKKISFLIENRARGVYNVGTGRKSVYDLARQRNPNVLPMSKNEISGVKLPHDVSMNIDKYNLFEKLMEDIYVRS